MKKFDRELIITLLQKGKEIYNDIITNYTDVLPKHITDGAERTINEDLPNRINTLIDILNLSEKKEKFHKINNLDGAIDFLQNDELDTSIELALANKGLTGYSTLKNEHLSLEDIIDNISFAIDSGVQYLHLQRVAGKLSKGEL